MIAVGQSLPAATFMIKTEDGPTPKETSEIFAGKKVVMFAVPGAFTPTCHLSHMPGFVEKFAEIKAKGADDIVCLTVNDPFVAGAWADATSATGKISMVTDPAAEFTKAIGMDIDLSVAGLGVRSQRYAMIVEDGVVKELMLEDAPKTAEASSADSVLAKL